MQLRLATGLSSEEYVKQSGWISASLHACPVHGDKGCAFRRHGTYERVEPPGTKVARFYCPEAHQTFSLLPDCLAAQLSSDLVEVEDVILTAEKAESLEAAARELISPRIQLPSALRWLRRRIQPVKKSLLSLLGLKPDLFSGLEPNLNSFHSRLVDTGLILPGASVLVFLRDLAEPFLQNLPAPLGFAHQRSVRPRSSRALQHEVGPDPP